MKNFLSFQIAAPIKKWWNGTYIPELPDSPFILGRYKRHWTSKLAHSVKNFYLKYWQWCWGMATACIAIYINMLRLGTHWVASCNNFWIQKSPMGFDWFSLPTISLIRSCDKASSNQCHTGWRAWTPPIDMPLCSALIAADQLRNIYREFCAHTKSCKNSKPQKPNK